MLKDESVDHLRAIIDTTNRCPTEPTKGILTFTSLLRLPARFDGRRFSCRHCCFSALLNRCGRLFFDHLREEVVYLGCDRFAAK